MRFTLVEGVICAAIVLLVIVAVVSIPATMHEHDTFMQDCTQHEPAYACQVKWKQMHPDPVFVYGSVR